MKRKHFQSRKEEYKLAMNEYLRVRGEKEKSYKSNTVDKCKEEPKLLYCSIKEK